MRTENEVLQNILSVADKEETVRAVIRTNLLPKRKYDITLFLWLMISTSMKAMCL